MSEDAEDPKVMTFSSGGRGVILRCVSLALWAPMFSPVKWGPCYPGHRWYTSHQDCGWGEIQLFVPVLPWPWGAAGSCLLVPRVLRCSLLSLAVSFGSNQAGSLHLPAIGHPHSRQGGVAVYSMVTSLLFTHRNSKLLPCNHPSRATVLISLL